jgi:hypothetical protein
MDSSKNQFILRGFRHVLDCRVFTFERIAADHSRSLITVRTDLALARKHQIPLQDLPLLCKGFLDSQEDSAATSAFVFGEVAMRLHADHVALRAEAAKLRKPSRRPHRELEDSDPGFPNPPFG